MRRYPGARLIRRDLREPVHEFQLRREGRMSHPCAVGALVENDRGQVLLVQPAPGAGWPPDCWMAPGGKVEPGESLESALGRELHEEAGIRGTITGLPKVFENIYTDGRATVRHTWFQFRVRADPGALHPHAADIREARWFDGLPATMLWREDYADLLVAPSASSGGRERTDPVRRA